MRLLLRLVNSRQEQGIHGVMNKETGRQCHRCKKWKRSFAT